MKPSAKTASSARLLSLDETTVGVLEKHRVRQIAERLKAGPLWHDTNLVFTQEDGTAVHPAGFTRWAQRQARAAGVPEYGVHGIRHTWATTALRLNVHPKVVSERLGHSSVKMTLDVYSHALPEMQQEAARTVAGALLRQNRVRARQRDPTGQKETSGSLPGVSWCPRSESNPDPTGRSVRRVPTRGVTSAV